MSSQRSFFDPTRQVAADRSNEGDQTRTPEQDADSHYDRMRRELSGKDDRFASPPPFTPPPPPPAHPSSQAGYAHPPAPPPMHPQAPPAPPQYSHAPHPGSAPSAPPHAPPMNGAPNPQAYGWGPMAPPHLDRGQLGRIFNTALVSTQPGTNRAHSDQLFEIMERQSFASLLDAVQSLAQQKQINFSDAAEELIRTFRQLDQIWKDYALEQGVDRIKRST